MKVTLVVPVRGDPDGHAFAAAGLEQQTRPPDEVVVVNADAAPGSRAV